VKGVDDAERQSIQRLTHVPSSVERKIATRLVGVFPAM
jgi:hypothetical protein